MDSRPLKLTLAACFVLAAFALSLSAQTAPAAYTDDFQSYGTQKNPPGWVDTAIGTSKPIAGGLYKTWPDPLQGNKGPNVVYGSKSASGKPEGNNPRIGHFSTLTSKTFSGNGRFEFRGRFLRTNTDSRIGLTFFSSYPEKDQYYLLGTWTQPSTGKLTMQLFGFGGGAPSGTIDSNFTPEANKWYAFTITAEDVGGKTYIRARFWLDTNPEPTTWNIDAVDAAATRFTQGRIGVWAAVKGEVYVDDLQANSPVDHTAPVISVIEDTSHAALQENARFKYEPSLTITAVDDVTAQPTITRLVDGVAYTNGTKITTQGNHTVFVRAVDSLGNSSEVTLHFYVDTLPPSIIVNAPQPNSETAAAVTIDYQATDATPPVTVTGTLNNAAWTPLDKPITSEGKYQLVLTATDGLGNIATTPAIPFTIDLTPPQVVLKANNQPLTTDNRVFAEDVRITLDVTDLTATTKTLLLDGAPYTEGTVISDEGPHRISGSVKDAVNHVTPIPERTFIIDKSKPVVVVLGNGQPMQTNYKDPVDLTIQITDFSTTTTSAKLNNATFTFPGRAANEAKYDLDVTVTDAAGHATTLDRITFYVDLTDPKVTVLANGQPFKSIYAQDVNITVTVEDLTATSKTITLDGAAITPPTLVSAEEPIPHVFSAVVSDVVGHTTTIAPVSFTIDKTPPSHTIRNGEQGSVIPNDFYFNETVHPFVAVDDRTQVTIDAKLNGAPFTNGAAVDAEGVYTLTGTLTDAAGNHADIGPLTFHIDKTAPTGVFMEGENAFPDGQSLSRNVSARVKVTDASPVTTEIRLDGELYTPDTPITSEALHSLTATLEDKAGNKGVVPAVSVRIDRTAPAVSLEANDQTFPHDFAFNKDIKIGVRATDVSGIQETWAIIDPGAERVTLPYTHTREGEFTVTGYATDKAGNTGHDGPVHFVLEKTPPPVVVKIDGQEAIPNFPYNHDVRVTIEVEGGLTTRTINATLNGQPFASGTLVTVESTKDHPHVIAGTVTTGSGLVVNIPSTPFILDKTPPAVTLKNRTLPFPATGSWLNEDVVPVATCEDAITRCTVKLVLDGVDWPNDTAVTVEKADHAPYRLLVSAKDDAGNIKELDPVEFVLDKTNPTITISEPADDAVLTSPEVVVKGTLEDAVTLQVNGVDATIDPAAKTFVTPPLPLVEGENVLTAIGIDRAGNAGTAAVRIVVDTLGPQLSVRTPAPNSCIASADLVVTGVVSDPNVDSVSVTVGAQSIPNALAADGRNWTATFTNVAEGSQTVVVEARDHQGHRTTASLPLFIDRGNPVVEVLEAGAPFTAKLVNRPVSLTIRVTDLDPSVRVFATYRGAPYASGTVISGDGLHHLDVVAIDCAGHQTAVPVDFTIRTTAPVFNSFTPPNGAVIGTMPATVGGNVTNAIRVDVDGTAVSAVPDASGDYVLNGLTITEGKNTFSLRAIDAAGNVANAIHSFTVKTGNPTVEIYEQGSVLPEGKLFNREVKLTFQSNDPDATVVAKVDGFTYNGQPIGGDDEHVVEATATDQLNHTGTVTRRFRIDRTPPHIEITAPAPGPVTTDHVDVVGNADDAESVRVNGVVAVMEANHTFRAANVPLEQDENLITAIGTDAAGNSGVDQVIVTYHVGPGIIITSPPEGLRTNRPRVDVLGYVMSPVRNDTVTIGSKTVAVDGAGAFRFDGYQLTEGANTISVKALGRDPNSTETTATVHVDADFTPPVLSVLAGDKPLTDNATFPDTISITATATDAGAAVDTQLTIDGAVQTTQPVVVSARGGHVLTAFAADRAGNETRIDRTFFIGASATSTGCSILSTDPKSGSAVTTNSVTIAGVAPGATSVKVAGIDAQVADGTFVATIDLPNEGTNAIAIRCTASDGIGTGALDITLIRATGAPTVEITEPAEGFVTGTSPIDVKGRVTGETKFVVVNGTNATLTGDTFVAKDIVLAEGINILVATARSSADRTGSDSVRVTYIAKQPDVSITSPLADYQTGASSVSVAGAWSDLDPTTLAISVSGATRETPVSLSHTNGTFRFTNVPLVLGDQTLTITGRSVLGKTATASVKVTRINNYPSITIDAPLDNAYLPAGTTIPVNGAYVASEGTRIEVNSAAATLNNEQKTYAGQTNFSTSGATTPIVARLTDVSGNIAYAAIRVHQLANDFTVTEAFPANGSQEVSPGVIVLVSFSHPVDLTTLDGLTLTGPNGIVTTTKYAQETVVSLAPTALLVPGATYTIRAAITLKDVAGTALKSEFTSTFTVANSGGGSAPQLDNVIVECGKPINITGTASPGARLLLETGPFRVNGTADASGKFTMLFPSSGQTGWQVVRVRVAGVDGSLSPAAEKSFRIDCAGPRVLAASFDRSVNTLTINFSKSIKPETINVSATGSVILTTSDGTTVAGTATTSNSIVTITPASDLSAQTFTLVVNDGVADTSGAKLVSDYTQVFSVDESPTPRDGDGYISGEVYDATNGRPLKTAQITISVPATAFARTPSANITTNISGSPQIAVTGSADARGRYTLAVPEGAHTIEASATSYTTAWRQIIVPAGAGIVPIDIRLTQRGPATTSTGAAINLEHGGETVLTKKIHAAIPAGVVPNGSRIALTSVGAQSLAGLLPLGWSPLASAELAVLGDGGVVQRDFVLSGAQLTFELPNDAIAAANKTLSLVQYDEDRDEWLTLVAVLTKGADGKWTAPVATTGAFAVVYPDTRTDLVKPSPATAGAPLKGVEPNCGTTTNPCALTKQAFDVAPKRVTPTQSAIAQLEITGIGTGTFPSGTAVQAYVSEVLNLPGGGTVLDAPFATDLLLYRTLDDSAGVATFNIAPSEQAKQYIIQDGVDHIQILHYPGRLDRGTLIGSEGGSVPGDDTVSVEIPSGATLVELHASSRALTASEQQSYAPIEGYEIVGGVSLTMSRATNPEPKDDDGDGQPDPVPAVELTRPARVTATVDAAKLPRTDAQLLLAEVLEDTPWHRVVRLAVPMIPVDAAQSSLAVRRYTTRTIDPTDLPVDGVIREGRYLVLAAKNDLAWATGILRVGEGGPYVRDGRISSHVPPDYHELGVLDLTRISGRFAVPVVAPNWSIIPRSLAEGAGARIDNTRAAVRDETIRLGDVILEMQPPAIEHITPDGSQPIDATDPFTVRIDFNMPINGDSAKNAVTMVNPATKELLGGTVSTANDIVTFTPNQPLMAGAKYVLSIAGSLAGTNGAPFSRTHTVTYTTLPEIRNTDIHPDRVHISIPVNGVSRIWADAGALPAGWLAVPVRRNNDFIQRYNATVKSDGTFSITIGDGPEDDRITANDTIDLQAVNTAGNVGALIRLTPFVTEDGLGFISPAGAEVTFTSKEGITVYVPEAAFAKPTLVRVNFEANNDAFKDVPNIANELNILRTVKLDFEGDAARQLNLAIPLGSGDPNRNYVLAQYVDFIRGPRVAIVDMMRVEGSGANARLTTTMPPSSGARSVHTNEWSDLQAKSCLIGVSHPGYFAPSDIAVPVGSLGWITVEMERIHNMMMDMWLGIIVPDFSMGTRKGCVAMPVKKGIAFTITGVDGATGLETFKKVYQPIPITDPGVTFPIENPNPDKVGPYPIYGAPFRVESLRMMTDIYKGKGFQLEIDSAGTFHFTANPLGTPTAEKLAKKTLVRIYNVNKATLSDARFVSNDTAQQLTFTMDVDKGDDLVVYIGTSDVDPQTSMSVVFSEPFDVGPLPAEPPNLGEAERSNLIDKNLRKVLKLELEQDSLTTDLTEMTRFGADTQNRRLLITLPASLVRGGRYRLTILKNFKDITNNKIGYKEDASGNPVGNGGTVDFTFEWVIRSNPTSVLGAFTLRPSASQSNGMLRDLAKSGNLAFVAAADGGLLAYDLSDPARLNPNAAGDPPLPLALVPSRSSGIMGFDEHWSVAVDQHGRVYSGGLMPSLSAVRSYRIEDFLEARDNPNAGCTDPDAPDHANCKFSGATIVGFRPGYSNAGMPNSTGFVIGGTPEGYPKKIELLEQDTKKKYNGLVPLKLNPSVVQVTTTPSFDPANPTALPADTVYNVDLKFTYPSSGGGYLIQRITVRNETLDLSWSKDVYLGENVTISIIMRRDDIVTTLRNERTFAVVDIFGYGPGIYDMNQVESNDVKIVHCADPAFKSLHGPLCAIAATRIDELERLITTPGTKEKACNSADVPKPFTGPPPQSIPNLNYSPTIHALVPLSGNDTSTTPPTPLYEKVRLFGIDNARGVLDLTYEMPKDAGDEPKSCTSRGKIGLVFRDRAMSWVHPRLVNIHSAITAKGWSPRFSDASMTHWEVPRESNLKGLRGSAPDTDVSRDYLLVAGNMYGLLIVDVGGTPPPNGPAEQYDELTKDHLADVIWIPAGAVAVRAIPKTNLATVLDGKGRLLLVDLSNIDERWAPPTVPNQPATMIMDVPFKTSDAALNGTGGPSDEIGVDDPRIIYKSPYIFASRPLAPIVDPETGIAFGGDVATRDMKVAAVLDPAVEVMVDAGSGLAPTGGIVPLGIAPPIKDAALASSPVGTPGRDYPNGALSAFRVRVSLPGAIAKSLPSNQITLSVESERVYGSDTEQTPKGLPRAHLRKNDRAGVADPRSVDFKLKWIMPNGTTAAEQAEFDKKYRHMAGYNHLISDWVVAIADPRASIHVKGTDTEKADAGCVSCIRPNYLKNKTEADDHVYEMFTKGRFIAVRPGSFGTTRYDYLNKAGRLELRVPTTMADTVREKQVAVAPIDPPVAHGLLQEKTYLHSGEVELNALDMILAGRGGMDTPLARTYRSRTIGGNALGLGWEAPYLRRLRQLPGGNVEYRDGAGEIHVFEPKEADPSASPVASVGQTLDRIIGTRVTYKSPPGLFLKLVRHTNGWMLIDQQWRLANFDNLGRLVSESDEFWTPSDPTAGNVVQYAYDPEGRLSHIIDPTGRVTKLTYWKSTDPNSASCTELGSRTSPCTYPGLLGEIFEQWRDRKVTFEYDKHGRLIGVQLPAAKAASGVPSDVPNFSTADARPRTSYKYFNATEPTTSEPIQSQVYTDFMKYAGNVIEVTDPQENAPASGGTPAPTPRPRVKFEYFTTGADWLDFVQYQYWPCANWDGSACAERHATFTYNPGLASTLTGVEDILGQVRTYDIAEQTDKRYHVKKETVVGVPTINAPDPDLSYNVTVNETAHPVDHITEVEQYNDQGAAEKTILASGVQREVHMDDPAGGAAGKVVSWVKEQAGSEQFKADLHYDSDLNNHPNSAASIVAVTRQQGSGAPVKRDAQSPNRERKRTQTYDAITEISNEIEYDDQGRPTDVEQRAGSGATAPNPGSGTLVSNEHYTYYADDSSASDYQRGLVHNVNNGGDLETTFEYAGGSAGGMVTTVTDTKRNVKTITTLDSWDRVIARTVEEPAYGMVVNETFAYDATGRLVYSSRTQKDLGKVETFMEYDLSGRVVKFTTTKNEVNGTAGKKLVRTTTYDLTGKKIVESDPFVEGGSPIAETVSTIDALGRTAEMERHAIGGAPGSPTVKSKIGYDMHNLPVYISDLTRRATISLNDGWGRPIGSRSTDGLRLKQSWDAWGQLVEMQQIDSSGNIVARTKNHYTPTGRLRATNEKIDSDPLDPDAGRMRHTHYIWFNAGFDTRQAVGEVSSIDALSAPSSKRMWRTERDSAGRVKMMTYGEGNGGGAPSPIWRQQEFIYRGGAAETILQREPHLGNLEVTIQREYDALDRVRKSTDGGYETRIDLDEAGNVLELTPPAGTGAITWKYDARGLQVQQAKSGGTVHREYDEIGTLRVYRDEQGRETTYLPDVLGRLSEIQYREDPTTTNVTSSENFEYDEAGQTKAFRDRRGHWFSYKYDGGGKVLSIHNVHTNPDDSNRIVQFEYDSAGRIFKITNADAQLVYEDYDMLGRPGKTRTIRYENHSGFGTATVLDQFAQKHTWSIHNSERLSWTMPVKGDPASVVNAAPWLTKIEENRDSSQSVTSQTAAGTSLFTATPGGVGRVRERFRDLPGGSLRTFYAFADLTFVNLHPDQKLNGVLRSAETSFANVPRAGSDILFDPSGRLHDNVDLGLAGRVSSWTYDGRGRLQTTKLLKPEADVATAPAITDHYLAADFRDARQLTTLFGPTEHGQIGDEQSFLIEPLAWNAGENGVHAVANQALLLDGAAEHLDGTSTAKTFANDGGLRTSNGEWSYEYDDQQRLIAKTNGARRIEYVYDPNGRVIGRHALSGSPGSWQPDSAALSRDGIPAKTSWAWDPVSDRLLAIYEEGASAGAPSAGLIRQFVHGDRGTDDLIQVLAANTSTSTVNRYFPIFDEAGSHSLQAVIGGDGNLIERVLYGDSYGDAPRYLQGALVDRITFASKKNPTTGKIEKVDVRLHVSERLRSATISSGVRIAALKSDGSVALAITEDPNVENDGASLHWTLDEAQWDALKAASGAASLEVSVNTTLRAEGWGDQPLNRVPIWAIGVYAGLSFDSTHPVMVRRSLANLATLSGDETEVPLFEVKDLYMASSVTSKTKLLTDFHGYPFREPADNTIFVRARWYDPATGAFLTPDPMGFNDSSNVYAAFGLDPVNHADPFGLWSRPNSGESREEYFHRLNEEGASNMEAAYTAECWYTKQCGSKTVTELARGVTAHSRALTKLYARVYVITAASMVTGGLAGAGVVAGGGSALLAGAVGGAVGGVTYQAGEDLTINGEWSSPQQYAMTAALGAAFGMLGTVIEPGPLNKGLWPEGVPNPDFGPWGVDPTMMPRDEAEGVLVGGAYRNNPTAVEIETLLQPTGKIGKLNGQYMYVVDESGRLLIGTRAGSYMPHPTLIGGEDPLVRAAGMVEIRGGRIYEVTNASGHYKPPFRSLQAAERAFGRLPAKSFAPNFKGFNSWE